MLSNGVSELDRPALIDGLAPVTFLNVADGCEQATPSASFVNPVEALHVCDLALQLVQQGVNPGDIGIITLYKAQADAISQQITSHTDAPMNGVQVSTVDAYQGAEKSVIILSTVRTRAKGFIEDPRRINVAITRAKK
eukprot:jgi/Hompol1/5126/HPOL_000437-RA